MNSILTKFNSKIGLKLNWIELKFNFKNGVKIGGEGIQDTCTKNNNSMPPYLRMG